MCGVVGYWEINNISQSKNLKKIITSMKCGLENRGPDDSGIWIDKKNNLFLGHTRLSIIETSNLGKQPMISKNERFHTSTKSETQHLSSSNDAVPQESPEPNPLRIILFFWIASMSLNSETKVRGIDALDVFPKL